MKKIMSSLWVFLMIGLALVFNVPTLLQAQTLEADVVVIGAGTSGLPAALEAAEAGANVIIFEKTSRTGGTGNMGMGPFGVETRIQGEQQVDITKDEAFDIFMTYTHWRVNSRLVRAYIDKSADTIEWLRNMGVEFVEAKSYFPQAKPTWHIVKNPEQEYPGGGAMAPALTAIANNVMEKGVQILFETPAKKIIKEDNRIVGVIGEDKSGNNVRVNAKAVVVATGGFGNNLEMIKEYTPYEWGVDVFSMRFPGLNGDGIRMAWEVGAAKHTEAMNIELTFGGIARGGSPAIQQPRAIMVNLHGKRFYNEGLMGNTTFTGNAIAQQKNRTGFLIIDSNIAEYYEKNGADTVSSVGQPIWDVGDVDSTMTKAVEKGMKGLFVADSLDDLAMQTGIDAASLKETVEEYNRFVDEGKDFDFNKRHEYLMPIKQPKFYAMQVAPSGYGSLGGIKINEKAEVLDPEDNPIPGLYAAGVDACSIYADSYVFFLPGNTMGFALNSGRIAGENAAKYVGK